jgi:hypothetical protein
MFENVVIRRPYTSNRMLDVGTLAETLLFYQNVNLILERGTLLDLLRTVGVDTFLRLIDDGHLKATIIRDALGVHHQTDESSSILGLLTFEAKPKKIGKWRPEREGVMEDLLQQALGKKPHRRVLRKFLEIPQKRLSKLGTHPDGVIGATREDLTNAEYIDKAAHLIVEGWAPGYAFPANSYFRVHETNNGYRVETNFDFAAINKQYHLYVPPSHSSMSAPTILSSLLDVQADMSLTADAMAEMVVGSQYSPVLRYKLAQLVRKRDRNTEQISMFQEMTLGNGAAVKEAINTGGKTLEDFLPILDKARKFKEWLAGQHPDARLLQEYHDAVRAETWIDRLPGKTARFGIFTGIGMGVDAFIQTGLGTTLGLGISVADTFFLDKFIQGWRPSQFIQDDLTEFTKE